MDIKNEKNNITRKVSSSTQLNFWENGQENRNAIDKWTCIQRVKT